MANVKIIVDNSTCFVLGLNVKQFSGLRDLMFYEEVAQNFFVEFATTKKYLLTKRGSFPTGLLYIVEHFLKANKIAHVVQDKRVRPDLDPLGLGSMFIGLDVIPYPEQVEAALAAVAYGRGIIVGPTGVGKSLLAALICDFFLVPTLIVVPSLELKTQTIKSLRDLFGADKIGELRPGQDPDYFISVANVDSIDLKKKLNGIDLLIIDEFHHSASGTYRELNRVSWSGIYFKFGLTATPFRSKDEERLLLESVLSHEIYRIPYQLAVDKGYIVPGEAYYYDLPKIKKPIPPVTKGRRKVELKKKDKYHEVYSELVVNRADRNALIVNLTMNLKEAGMSTLVLTRQVDHGEALKAQLHYAGCNVPFIHGTAQNNRMRLLEFNLREELAVIGTVGVMGEGVDTKPAEWVILTGLGKSRNQFMQAFGRVFRVYEGKLSGKIVLFRDPSHKWTLAHFNAQVKILREEYGIKIVKLPWPTA